MARHSAASAQAAGFTNGWSTACKPPRLPFRCCTYLWRVSISCLLLLVQTDRTLLCNLEAQAPQATGGNWAAGLGPDFLANLGRYRRYNIASLRDLLRVIRNKHNHFWELPEELQQQLGPLPEGFVRCGGCRLTRGEYLWGPDSEAAHFWCAARLRLLFGVPPPPSCCTGSLGPCREVLMCLQVKGPPVVYNSASLTQAFEGVQS